MASWNLGPLTASQSLPESCAADLESVHKIRTTPEGYYWLQHGPLSSSCFPSGYSALTAQYYSPARCPYGYTPACGTTNAIGTVTETIQTCCPTQYEYKCQTDPTYQWEATLGCSNAVTEGASTTWIVEDITGGFAETTTSPGLQGGLNAFSIQVRWQSDDFATTTASTNSPTLTSASGGETSASSSNEDNSDESGSSLGTGAIVGIAIGSVAAVALLAALIFLFARRQRQKRNESSAPTSFVPPQEVPAWPSPGVEPKYYQPVHPAELDTGFAPAEMDAGHGQQRDYR